MAPSQCTAPNCPITELKSTVGKIDEKTDKIIEINISMTFIKERIEKQGEDINKLYKRMREIEETRPSKSDFYTVFGIMAAVIVIVGAILKWTGVVI